jgi:CheY-like chemotaxis protein
MPSKKAVMVIDDEPDLLGITMKILEKNGFIVHAFNNPVEALGHVEKVGGCKECGTIISDIRMPGMTGLELAMRLKAIRPELKIVLMTAFAIQKDDMQNIIPSIKVDAFLNKPFTTTELIEAVKESANKSEPV